MNHQKQNFSEQEKEILKFWEKEKIFEKSLEKTKKSPKFVFYEGPPFANGLPGIHHLVSRAFKDIIIRYKTMRGFFVERKAGWDTHGLPTEISAEKKLGIKTKKDIEKIGIEKFIQACRESIFTYKKEWEEFTRRIGYWLDLKNAYITCRNDYIESLWWILKEVWKKGLLYEDYKVVPYCPRCGTSLSSHELAQGYKKVKELTIYVKFKLKNQKPKAKNQNDKSKFKNFSNTYFLVWTTTPWTLPGNVALAVGKDIKYTIAEFLDLQSKEKFKLIFSNTILGELGEKFKAALVEDVDDDKQVNKAKNKNFDYAYETLKEIKGKDLFGLEYEPLYDFIKPDKPAYKVIAGDFVSTEEGTGIVHIAPAFGEDDMRVIKNQKPKAKNQNDKSKFKSEENSKNNQFPILVTVDQEGKMITPGYKWDKMFVKDADPLIIENLKKRNLLFKEEMYEHEYPFCWRCNTPLIYYAKNSWFIKMTAIKEELIKNDEKINWIPKHIKKGRFGEWLKEVKDWNLTRERYWGAPLPVWKCEQCKEVKIIGSVKELEKLSGKKVKDLHRPHVDNISFKCGKCGAEMKRVPEVIDCWFDSGSMPYAQWHYPFDSNSISSQSSDNYGARNKKSSISLPKNFPADFICEGIDQTRGWFYTLLAISTLLELGPSYKNVISHGLVLDSKGQKMSKSKGNIVRPQEVIEKFGADCARFYFYTVNQVGEPKRFDFKEIQDLHRKFFYTLQNSFAFFETYTKKSKVKSMPRTETEFLVRGQKLKVNLKTQNLLDKWIISKLNNLNREVAKDLDDYDIVSAARLFENFVDDLSNWYIRRSRRRFQKPEREEEKEEASMVLRYIFLNLVKLLAPFTPFISEKIYKQIANSRQPESVHLCDWPETDESLIDKKLEEEMKKVREIVAQALAKRAEAGIKIRQPLNELRITNYELEDKRELLKLIKDEVNVKKITFGKNLKLDTKITSSLRKEGLARELARYIQGARKAAGYIPQDSILAQIVFLEFSPQIERAVKTYRDYIKKETGTCQLNLTKGRTLLEEFDFGKEIILERKKIWLGIKKM